MDTPEIQGRCAAEKSRARQARDYTKAVLSSAQQIELHDIERGKYFRLVAAVSVDGQDLATSLIPSGHTRPYTGGRRQGWCE